MVDNLRSEDKEVNSLQFFSEPKATALIDITTQEDITTHQGPDKRKRSLTTKGVSFMYFQKNSLISASVV